MQLPKGPELVLGAGRDPECHGSPGLKASGAHSSRGMSLVLFLFFCLGTLLVVLTESKKTNHHIWGSSK